MLFNFSLDQKELKALDFQSFLKLAADYKWYIIVAIISIILFTAGSTIAALTVGVGGSIAAYGYTLWADLSALNFTFKIDGFDLRDIIGDLEAG